MNFKNYKKNKQKKERDTGFCRCTFEKTESHSADGIVEQCPVCGGKRITNNTIKLLGRVIA